MESGWVPVPNNLRCRLLFGSPICVLVTPNSSFMDGGHPFNAMTVSWLTAADNQKTFIMSINTRRHTLVNLLREKEFTLSVAVAGMESALLSFGSLSGHSHCDTVATETVNQRECKFSRYIASAPWIVPGTAVSWNAKEGERLPVYGAASPAHMICRLRSVLCASTDATSHDEGLLEVKADGAASGARETCVVVSGSGASGLAKASPRGKRPRDLKSESAGPNQHHTLLLCEITSAWVKKNYWHFGKIFGSCIPATPSGALLPPPLAFAGTKQFAHIMLQPFTSEGSGGSSEPAMSAVSVPETGVWEEESSSGAAGAAVLSFPLAEPATLASVAMMPVDKAPQIH
jgi:flavin reductase (DIM6/NTAB) family NADH-FMN oxidoreductase RutF